MSIFQKCSSKSPGLLGLPVLQNYLKHYFIANTLRFYGALTYKEPIRHCRKLISKKGFKSLHGSSVKLVCSNHGNSKDVQTDNDSVSDTGVDFSNMTPDECRIHHIHQEACKANEDTYIDSATGYTVLTRVFHIKKGKCCGNACRHCPYNHMGVPKEYRKKKFNSSFYV